MDVLTIVWATRLQFAIANSSHAFSTPATTLADINAEVEACELVSKTILDLVEDMEAVDKYLNAFNKFLGAAADKGVDVKDMRVVSDVMQHNVVVLRRVADLAETRCGWQHVGA